MGYSAKASAPVRPRPCEPQHNLRRSHLCVYVRSSLHLVRFGQLLRRAHKHVHIMKMYIERNNMQVELIRSRKKRSTLFAFSFGKRPIYNRCDVYAWKVFPKNCLFLCTLLSWKVITTGACSINVNETNLLLFTPFLTV